MTTEHLNDASVAEVLREINEYEKLEANWDSEGALAISHDAARLAAWLVQMVALSARYQSVSWRPPVVGPSADGGINLEWEGEGRQLLVMIRPGQQHLVECAIEEAGSLSRRQTVSVWDIIDQALRATRILTEPECLA